MKTLTVASTTNVGSLAGAIASNLDNDTEVLLTAIAGKSINQAIKALALARQEFHTPINKIPLSNISVIPIFIKVPDKFKKDSYTRGMSLLVRRGCEGGVIQDTIQETITELEGRTPTLPT